MAVYAHGHMKQGPKQKSGESSKFVAAMDLIFALDQNGQTSPVTNGDVVTWMVAMFPGEQPPEDRWYQIPANLLPSNLSVAYVYFLAFLELRRADFAPAPRGDSHRTNTRPHVDLRARGDTRPIITDDWREAHPNEWQRLWDDRPEECPVCHERPDVWDGPMNSDVPSRCTHWACVGCWRRIAGRDRRCPICRTSLRGWLSGR